MEKQQQGPPPDIKLVVLGEGGVGKSALTIQLVQGQFVDEYDPTIEDCYQKAMHISGVYEGKDGPSTELNEDVILDVLDTAGQEEYSAMREQYIRNGDGFLLVYSVNSKETFDQALELLKTIKRNKDYGDDEDIPVIFVANKADLPHDPNIRFGEEEAREKHCLWIKTSAKDNHNVEKAFALIATRYRQMELRRTYLQNQVFKLEEQKMRNSKQSCACIML